MRTVLAIGIFFIFLLTACSNQPSDPYDEEESSPYKVVYLAQQQTGSSVKCQVHLAELDGSNDTIVLTSDTLFQTITWLGNYFYLGTIENSQGVIYFVKYDGSDLTRYVLSEAVPNKDLKFSYNGKFIITEDQDRFTILDISDWSLITHLGNNPVWFPTKSNAVFDRIGTDISEIAQVASKSETPSVLSLASENASCPSISQNSNKIAYAVNNESSSIIITADTDGENKDMKANVDYPIVETLWRPSDTEMPLFITQGGEHATSEENILWKTSASGPMAVHKFYGYKNEFVWHPEKDILYFVEEEESGNTIIGTFNMETNKQGVWNYNPEIEILDFFITYGR